MNLSKLDDKMVRIEDTDGGIYEGICMHNSREYNYHEYGRDEEGLEMDNILFYKSYIKKAKKINEFSAEYGKLEELVVESGMDIIDEVLNSEENISIYRLLLCLEDNIGSFPKEEKTKLIKELDSLIKYNTDNEIKEKALKLKEMIEK